MRFSLRSILASHTTEFAVVRLAFEERFHITIGFAEPKTAATPFATVLAFWYNASPCGLGLTLIYFYMSCRVAPNRPFAALGRGRSTVRFWVWAPTRAP